MNDEEQKLISQFESKNIGFAIAYGGDGELLKVVARYGNKKSIIPIRDYGKCEKHKNLLEDICLEKDSNALRHGLKYTKASFLEIQMNDELVCSKAISEIVVKNVDMTEALRFTVNVNGKEYMRQCIADGIIFASKLGSHGYFKSVARTLFTDDDSIGIGFIAPTYGICNLVLKMTDKVEVAIERKANISISADKSIYSKHLEAGAKMQFKQSCDGVALFGYDMFCCPECRRLRNSTVVNDQWLG
jgi:NAD kinase